MGPSSAYLKLKMNLFQSSPNYYIKITIQTQIQDLNKTGLFSFVAFRRLSCPNRFFGNQLKLVIGKIPSKSSRRLEVFFD
jgi:hypothetical protein